VDRSAAEQRDPATGELTYNAGNICIHWYRCVWLPLSWSLGALSSSGPPSLQYRVSSHRVLPGQAA